MAGELIGAKMRQRGRSPDDRRSLGEIVLRERNAGRIMLDIAHDLGISEDTALRYMKLALDARIPPTVDEFRRQENDRLDRTQRTVEENLAIAERLLTYYATQQSTVGIERAVKLRNEAEALQLRLNERRARLNGLDAPVVVQATVTHLDEVDAELAQMVSEAKAKAPRPEELRHGD